MSSSLSFSSLSSFSSSERMKNPFTIDDSCGVFGYKDAQNLKMQMEREKLKNYTIEQRQAMLKPTNSAYISPHATRPGSKFASPPPSYRKTAPNEKVPQAKRMSEFIQQKRDVFLIQLLIDQKNEEIKKINNTIYQSEKNYLESEDRFKDLTQKYKYISQQSDKAVAKQRMAAEAASCTKNELLKQLKQTTHSIGIIRADISKNQEMLENYTSYHDFLMRIKPKDKPVEWYFDDPKKLEDEFDKYEKENLFLMNQSLAIDEQMSNGAKNYSNALETIKSTLEQIENTQIEQEKENINFKNAQNSVIQESQKIDDELELIKKQVHKTYVRIYGTDSQISEMLMLEKINRDIEELYSDITLLRASYYAEKQAVCDKIRREEQRVELQKQKEIIQQEKKDAAIARANKPIKKKMGRPLIPRTNIRKVRRNDDERARRIAMEQKKQEEFLFGDRMML